MKQFFISLFFTVYFGLSAHTYAQPALEELIITSSKIEVPIREVGASISVIDSDEIQLRGYQSVADVLRTLPSVGVSNQGGAGKVTTLRIRGEEGYRTLILVDGIELSDPSAPQAVAYPQHISGTQTIERIEVLRGPQGFLYGADAGGVVNVITRTAQEFTSELSAEMGAFDSSNLQGFVANGGEGGDVFLSVNRQKTDGFNAYSEDASEDEDSYQNTTIHGKGTWQINSKASLSGVVRDIDSRNEYDNCGFPTTHDCFDKTRQAISKITLQLGDENLNHDFAIAKTNTDRDYYSDGALSYAAEGTVKKTSYLGAWRASTAFNLVWGGDYKEEDLATNYGDISERNSTGLFGEVQSNINNQFFVSAGARFDEDNEYGSHTSVRIAPAFVHNLNKTLTLKYRASYGTGFRAPSLSELAYNKGPYAYGEALDVVLTEEQSEGFDVAIELFGSNGASASVGYFDQQVEDEIYYDLVNYSGYLKAEGISHSKGWELSLEYPLAKWLDLETSYTYNETLTEDDQPRVRRPKHLLNLSFACSWLNERLQLLLNLRRANDAIATDDTKLPNYTVLDISSRFKINAHFTVFARLENAANEEYYEVKYYNTAERAFYGGLKYSF